MRTAFGRTFQMGYPLVEPHVHFRQKTAKSTRFRHAPYTHNFKNRGNMGPNKGMLRKKTLITLGKLCHAKWAAQCRLCKLKREPPRDWAFNMLGQARRKLTVAY